MNDREITDSFNETYLICQYRVFHNDSSKLEVKLYNILRFIRYLFPLKGYLKIPKKNNYCCWHDPHGEILVYRENHTSRVVILYSL